MVRNWPILFIVVALSLVTKLFKELKKAFTLNTLINIHFS